MKSDSPLVSALSDARRFLGEFPLPPNEANTCDWVIRPLLLALGYEIHAQSLDIASRFPDYTILPNTEWTWYLEAKSWSVGLDSTHVDQAMNYAHSNGRRWVVLSNGQEWRLYDDTILGKSADRLVATARLEDEHSMARFLTALSKESMTAGQVTNFAAERRIRDFLQREILDAKGSVVTGIVKAVRAGLPGVAVNGEVVVSLLNAATTMPPAPAERSVRRETPARPPAASEYPTEPDEIFFCKGPEAEARGKYENGGLVVLQGSRCRKTPVASITGDVDVTIQNLIAQGILRTEDRQYVFEKDHYFRTPSGAAQIVLARSANGWREWKRQDGRQLREFYGTARQADEAV